MKVLFVCLGNICRSPIAEGIFNKLIQEKQLDWQSDSAGTSRSHKGEKADIRMKEIAQKHGIELLSCSRAVEEEDFYIFDCIIAMDEKNLLDLQNMQLPNSTAKLHLLREFDTEKTNPNVEDPYWGGKDGFENCYQVIYRCINKFINMHIST